MSFPNDVMSKALKPETSKEVDDNPSIYNAKDYNIHHREIIAIERNLIGSSTEQTSSTQDVLSGLGSENGGSNILSILNRYIELLDLIHNKGYIGQYSGTFQPNGQVPIPPALISTQTNGDIGVSDTTIYVTSTDGFPNNGIITKFNHITPIEMCVNNTSPGGGSRCADYFVKTIRYAEISSGPTGMTNQENISYTGKTSNSFTGCTRRLFNTTAQEAKSITPALILCGRAAISFSHNFLNSTNIPSNFQFYLAHDAMLKVNAEILGPSSSSRIGNPIQEFIEISWLLTISGYFSDININQLFNI